MTLIIENKNAKPQFVLYIKNRMLRYALRILNTKKLNVYDEYFNSEEFETLTCGVHISSRQVVWLALTHLTQKSSEEGTQIFINPNLLYPGTQLKVETLCKVINYGTLTLEAYPIFTFTFHHFQNNIKKYLNRYIRGMGV